MSLTKSSLLVAAILATGAFGFVVGRIASSPPPARSTRTAGVALDLSAFPRVPAVTAPTHRLDLTEKPPLAEVIDLFEATLRSGGFRMNKRWEIIINSLGPDEMPQLMEVLDQYGPSNARAQLRRALHSRWAEFAPPAALDHAQSLAIKSERDRATDAVFSGWAYTDPVALAKWARNLPSRRRTQHRDSRSPAARR
jgi:hypothetical protein